LLGHMTVKHTRPQFEKAKVKKLLLNDYIYVVIRTTLATEDA
jgi:hypothetical protein